jgi:3-hydroxyisobutyrate dehydrogenase
MQKPSIGFVGVGRMGANMARRLKDLGYSITALYDSHAPLADELATELGSVSMQTLPQVTAAAEVIFTVVSDDAAMRKIFSGDDDSLLKAAVGKTFINCATVSPEVHEAAAKAAVAAGAKTLAASMASSIPQARDGTLYLMVGGKPEVFEEKQPLLADISASCRHVGSVGDAAKIKALVNMVMNINTAGLAEGLGLGATLGFDPAMLVEIFAQTGADSRVLATDAADMIHREHDCYFSVAHAAKDSGIANALALATGVHTPLSLATEAQYLKLTNSGHGHLDKSGISELTFPGRA